MFQLYGLITLPWKTQSPCCEEAQVGVWTGPHGKLRLLADSPHTLGSQLTGSTHFQHVNMLGQLDMLRHPVSPSPHLMPHEAQCSEGR